MAFTVGFYVIMGQQQQQQPACWLRHTHYRVTTKSSFMFFFLFPAFQLPDGVFGQALYDLSLLIFFLILRGNGIDWVLGIDEDLYTGASRAWHFDCIIHLVHRGGAQKKSSLGPGDSGWAAYNRYHITICSSMDVLSPPFSPPLCCDLIGVGTKFI